MGSNDSSPQTPCYFLDHLPREIRDEIYRHLVVDKCERHRSFRQHMKGVGILFANKQIYDEAMQIFYRENHFDVTVKYRWEDNKLYVRSQSSTS
jgi:hypothetical protein